MAREVGLELGEKLGEGDNIIQMHCEAFFKNQ